jgi:protein SCO1/2
MRRRLLACWLATGLLPAAWSHEADTQQARDDLAGWVLTPFALTDHEGRPFTQERLRGRWTFVVVGDAGTCGAPCAGALAALAGLFQRIAGTDVLKTTQVLFLSLAPEHDTARRLRAYLAAFDPRFVGATGAPPAVQWLAGELGAQLPSGASPRSAGTLVLVRPDAAIRTEYLPPFDVPRLTAAYLRARLGKDCVCGAVADGQRE